MDWSVVLGPEGRQLLLSGLKVTLQLTLVGAIGSSILGIVVGLLGSSTSRITLPFRLLSHAFTEISRNVPFLLHLSIWYFAVFSLPVLRPVAGAINDNFVPGFAAASCALIVYRAGYMGEIVRSGLHSVPAGQMRAARSSGLSYRSSMQSVVLPQALRSVFPALANQLIGVTKNTGVVLVIGVPDLVYQAYEIQSKTFQVFVVFGAAIVLFTALCMLEGAAMNLIFRRLEKRWSGKPGVLHVGSAANAKAAQTVAD